MVTGTVFKEFYFKPLTLYSVEEQRKIIKEIKRIEKKTFPTNEAFDFDWELKKKNATLIVATKHSSPLEIVAYLVYVRIRRLTWIHKLCVIEEERGKGIAKEMIKVLRLELERAGCQNIQLWVDEDRIAARSLYRSCEFHQIDHCVDYYGQGRTGLKMELTLGQ